MNKENSMYILLVVLGVLLFAFLWNSEKNRKTAQQALNTPQAYQTTSDLDAASKELDSANLNQVDSELKLIDSDTNF